MFLHTLNPTSMDPKFTYVHVYIIYDLGKENSYIFNALILLFAGLIVGMVYTKLPDVKYAWDFDSTSLSLFV